jgi:hypothetical protein
MLRAFDGKGFHPHGLLQSLAIQLGGKTVTVDVKVVNDPLDYNLFTWKKLVLCYECHCFIGISMHTISS